MFTKLLTSKRLWLAVSGLCLAYLVSLMLTTTPQEVGPGGVISWFSAAYILVLASLLSLHGYILHRDDQLSLLAVSRYSLASVGVISLVALRSLGQLQLRDLILILLLLAVLGLYMRRLTQTRK